MNNQKIARIGENIAFSYLKSKSYHILAKNLKFCEGEIDLIAQKDKLIVFVEVKTRTSQFFGYPEEAFNQTKRKRLELAIDKYIYKHNYQGDWRVDLITIIIQAKKAYLRHYISLEL